MKFDWADLRSKKVLGVPLLYPAILFVGILVYFAWHLKSADTTDDTSTDDGSGSGDGSADVSSDPDYSSLATNGTVTVSQPGEPDATTPVNNQTNDTWVSQGVAYLIAQGMATGGDAEQALDLYINGGQLSYDQGVLRDAVIKQYGLPPDPPTASGGTMAPIAKRQGNPPLVHTVQGANDNSYHELTQLYYGRQDSEAIDLLQEANPALGHEGGSWQPGTKVTIPAYHPPVYFTATSAARSLSAIAAKNGISTAVLQDLNDGVKFPVAVGKKVRVK